ncbi:MAG: SAM-dependent methyltransferase [Oscillatoriales cyanobacterium RM2_1_1]|nr:SAM-dependent methyltransferase [Oscillatoriales cyanobacterium SM2_3_0]NJO46596.1 SAM-dependent methyltransferase [Oscillatoriales cyanobacterium RM2_1_1]
MGLQLNTIIPWGRNLDEYVAMFGLDAQALKLNILDCAAGLASFNAEMTVRGHRVTSWDPIYQFSTDEIAQRIQDTYPTVISGVRANLESYVWQTLKSPDHLGEVRMAAMQRFLEDFPAGLSQGRYLRAALPQLPGSAQHFDLALCSHFLFTYSDQLSQPFHRDSVLELCRVAREVRVFPLLTLSGEPSPFLEPILAELSDAGYNYRIQPVAYEFQRGSNRMLQIYRS